jgi:hypothetical protein
MANPVVANNLVIPIDGTAASPSLSFGGTGGFAAGSSGTGIYGTFGSIKHSLDGVLALTLDSTGLSLAAGNIAAAAGTRLAIGDTVIMTKAGAPIDGTTGANVAGIGSILSDITNGILYINTGTKVSPTWTKVGTQT